jgi:hypothetical protein
MGPVRVKVAVAGIVLAIAAASSPASAESDGCLALGTHAVNPGNQRPWDCFFTATGPSYFVAATSNPFVIAVSRDAGASWIELVRRPTPGAPTGGVVATEAGDLVSVSISCWHYPDKRSCSDQGIGGRDGAIWAHSEF